MTEPPSEPYFTVCGAQNMPPETLGALAEAAKAIMANYKTLQLNDEDPAPPLVPLTAPNRAARRRAGKGPLHRERSYWG